MRRPIAMAAASLAAAMLLSAAPEAQADGASDAEVVAMMRKHCVMCHAHAPTHPSFDTPPKNVTLETIDEVKAWAVKVVEQVVLDRNMPVGNETEMTEEERAALAHWAEGLK